MEVSTKGWIIIGVFVLVCVVGGWLHSVIENVSSRGKYEIVISADGSQAYVLNTHTGKHTELRQGTQSIPATYQIVMAADGSKAYILDTRLGYVWGVTTYGLGTLAPPGEWKTLAIVDSKKGRVTDCVVACGFDRNYRNYRCDNKVSCCTYSMR